MKIDRSELLSIAHFALIALYLNVAVFICGRLGCFAMIRANVLNLAQATACGFGMGSLSAGSTALPFAPTISDHAQNQIIILDMGNKVTLSLQQQPPHKGGIVVRICFMYLLDGAVCIFVPM